MSNMSRGCADSARGAEPVLANQPGFMGLSPLLSNFGLIVSPPKIHVCPEPQNMTFFGNIFTNIIC